MPWTKRTILAWVGMLLVLATGCLYLQYGGPTGFIQVCRGVYLRRAGLNPDFRFEGFLDCSTVPQDIDYAQSTNWTSKQENGNIFLTPTDPSKPAFIRIRLKKEFDEYIFYPRVAEGGEVYVCEATPLNVLFRLGDESSWTPLERRYMINLGGVEFGYVTKQIFVELIVVLRGQRAQLWLPAGKAFFR